MGCSLLYKDKKRKRYRNEFLQCLKEVGFHALICVSEPLLSCSLHLLTVVILDRQIKKQKQEKLRLAIKILKKTT